MSFESDGEGNEIWTCDTCGHSVFLYGEGGDVADCIECVARDVEMDAMRDSQRDETKQTCKRCGKKLEDALLFNDLFRWCDDCAKDAEEKTA